MRIDATSDRAAALTSIQNATALCQVSGLTNTGAILAAVRCAPKLAQRSQTEGHQNATCPLRQAGLSGRSRSLGLGAYVDPKAVRSSGVNDSVISRF